MLYKLKTEPEKYKNSSQSMLCNPKSSLCSEEIVILINSTKLFQNIYFFNSHSIYFIFTFTT